MDRIAINIATCDRPTELYGLLSSIACQTIDNWDLVIIDQSQQPVINHASISAILSRFKFDKHHVGYYYEPVKHGISAARNLAIKKTPEDINYFVRIDDDSLCAPDYLERLYNIAKKDKTIGAVGGIVPTLNAPNYTKEFKVEPFNKIVFKKKGINVGDDGGYQWSPSGVYDSDHLRSSFLFTRGAAEIAGLHPEDQGGSVSGFREETTFTMKMKVAGCELLTDTGAICWHNRVPYGGARGRTSEEYKQAVDLNEAHFQTYWMREKRLGKIPKGTFEGV